MQGSAAVVNTAVIMTDKCTFCALVSKQEIVITCIIPANQRWDTDGYLMGETLPKTDDYIKQILSKAKRNSRKTQTTVIDK